jgi:hypothetical protein
VYHDSVDEWWSGQARAGEDLRTLSPEWVWELADKYGFQPNFSGPTSRDQYPDLFNDLNTAKGPSRSAARNMVICDLEQRNQTCVEEQIEQLTNEFLEGYSFRLWSFLCFTCRERPNTYRPASLVQ